MSVSDLLAPGGEAMPQLPAHESKLMKHFRKIRRKSSRILVIQVAQLAAKAEAA